MQAIEQAISLMISHFLKIKKPKTIHKKKTKQKKQQQHMKI